jgi:hypothetical protein
MLKILSKLEVGLNLLILKLVSAITFIGLVPLLVYILYYNFYSPQFFRVISGSIVLVVCIYVNKAVQGGSR